MRGTISARFLCAFATCIGAVYAQAIQPVVVNLPPTTDGSPPSSLALDVNSMGQITGSYWSDIRTLNNFIWQNGTTTTFDSGGGGTTPVSINDNGAVLLNNDSIPAIRAGGLSVPLPRLRTLVPSYVTASGINNSRQVTGCLTRYIPITIEGIPSQLPVSQNSYLWPAVGPAQQVGLDVPGSFVCAPALNNSAQVILNSSSLNFHKPSQAYFWQAGKASQNLGTLDNTKGSTFAWDINDFGQVVGYSAITYSDANAINLRAFLWQSGTMQNLGLPPGAVRSWAFAIDSTGTRILVGSQDASAQPSYWLLKDGVFTQLAGFGNLFLSEGSKTGSIAATNTGAIAVSVCPSGGFSVACYWNLP